MFAKFSFSIQLHVVIIVFIKITLLVKKVLNN